MLTFLKNESGLTAIEYGVLSGIMGAIVIMAWTPVYISITDVVGQLVQNLMLS
jgi:Flp pilus assembly pilin Flp